MYVVKLGGSVITDKRKLYCFRPAVARRLLGEIKASGEKVVLVHGAGSFGHIMATKYRLKYGLRDDAQRLGVAIVQRDVRDLNLRMVKLALDAGLRPVSIPPAMTVLNDDGAIANFNSAVFQACAAQGLTPVTFGDVVFDMSLGFSICSGDDLALELSRVLKPKKAVFVADADGIFDKDPKNHEDARLLERVDGRALGRLKRHARTCRKCTENKDRDATGGMLRKIEIMLEISKLGTGAVILNGLVPGRLKDCLKGRKVAGSSTVPGKR